MADLTEPQRNAILDRVVTILERARAAAVRTINTQMTVAYWLIGREIVEEEQLGEARAAYGAQLIEDLSKSLKERYGRGFSVPNLRNFRQFYLCFPDRLSTPGNGHSGVSPEKRYTVCSESWEEAIAAANESLSQSPSAIPARVGQRVCLCEPSGAVDARRRSLLPRPSFYHVKLKCYVVIDLKVDRLTHGDLGQMLMYVHYYDREVCTEGDGPTLGLILCTDKNDAMVRYVLDEQNETIFASRYKLHLPSEDELRQEIERERLLLESDDANSDG